MKRIFVCFLVICLLANFFIFNSFADSLPAASLIIQTSSDGSTWTNRNAPLLNGIAFQGFYNHYKLSSITLYRGGLQSIAYLRFRVYLVYNSDAAYGNAYNCGNYPSQKRTGVSSSSVDNFIQQSYVIASRWGTPYLDDKYSTYTSIEYTIIVDWSKTTQDSVVISIVNNYQYDLIATHDNNYIASYLAFDNVCYSSANDTILLSQLYDLDIIAAAQSSISSAVLSIHSNLSNLFSNNYSYSERITDSDGNVTFVQRVGNWFDSVLGNLNSLLGDIGEQAEQLEKAKSAGAVDSLEDAYDSAGSGSFGAIGDLGFGSLGNWSTAPFENAGDSVLDWFSQSCAEDLDTVPRSRSDDDYVDFYSDHYQDILDLIGGDDE